MTDGGFNFDAEDIFKDKIAQIHQEFDQFSAAILEVAQTVIDYRKKLRTSRAFSKEEQFMLTMSYQDMVLGAILRGNIGGGLEEGPFSE